MVSACTTCTATSGNERRTAGTTATWARPPTAVPGAGAIATTGLCAAAPGPTARATCVRTLAPGSPRRTAATPSASVLSRTRDRFGFFLFPVSRAKRSRGQWAGRHLAWRMSQQTIDRPGRPACRLNRTQGQFRRQGERDELVSGGLEEICGFQR